MSDINGKVINCYLQSRGEVVFYARADGTVVANLDGYAIIPLDVWENVNAAFEAGVTQKVDAELARIVSGADRTDPGTA